MLGVEAFLSQERGRKGLTLYYLIFPCLKQQNSYHCPGALAHLFSNTRLPSLLPPPAPRRAAWSPPCSRQGLSRQEGEPQPPGGSAPLRGRVLPPPGAPLAAGWGAGPSRGGTGGAARWGPQGAAEAAAAAAAPPLQPWVSRGCRGRGLCVCVWGAGPSGGGEGGLRRPPPLSLRGERLRAALRRRPHGQKMSVAAGERLGTASGRGAGWAAAAWRSGAASGPAVCQPVRGPGRWRVPLSPSLLPCGWEVRPALMETGWCAGGPCFGRAWGVCAGEEALVEENTCFLLAVGWLRESLFSL